MPPGFAKDLGYSSENFSFTSCLKLGLETTIPELKKGEKVYFQYLAAANIKQTGADYPNGSDLCFYAINIPKKLLIERLKIPD